LKQVGLVGAATAVPVKLFASGAFAPAAGAHWAAQTLAPALETLTAAESTTLTAMLARLIPADEAGPGAVEAGAGRYIDRALGGALASSRDAYQAGLAAVDAYARSSRGAPFAELAHDLQDAVLRDVEADLATGFGTASSVFFNLVRTHAIQGTFCDPYYGGNANFVGWDLIGYPGLRLAVSADEQHLDVRAKPVRRSAYDHTMFSNKKPSRARIGADPSSHGD
jgi:gluconate 2-dehydrogenase gamma chain